MPDREQPFDLAYAPPTYPSHDYTGDGDVVSVRVGTERVGYLTRKGDAVDWLPNGNNPSEAADAVRIMVWEILSEGARTDRPLIDAWADVLDNTQHDAPTYGPLSKLRS